MGNNEQNNIHEFITTDILDKLKGEDLNKLNQWLQHTPENKKLYEETKNAWNFASLVNPRSNFSSENGWKEFIKLKNTGKHTLPISKGLKIAVSLLLAFTLGALAYYFFNRTVLNNNIKKAEMFETVVPNGSKSELFLSDGTKVWLNAGTTLSYNSDFNPHKRIVILDGEAYFDVAKDPRHPFVVRVGDVEVKAVGTAFNIKAYAGEKTIETTLVEGKVLVSKDGVEKPIVMKPRQKLTFVKNQKDFEYSLNELKRNDAEERAKESISMAKKASNAILEKKVDIKPEISWKENEWFISGMSLEELAVNLQRRYDVFIKISNEDLKKYRFTGTILNESLEQVLTYMSRIAPINYIIDGKEVEFSVNREFMIEYQKVLKTINN